MSQQQQAGFGQFIPGFDFLQNLAKGASASMPHMPNLSSWIAPTLNVEELDKRIGELKAVQFWLDQNKAALSATIQALEVQKMTLATLRGMNFNMADLAAAMKVDPHAGAAAAKAKTARKGEPMSGGKSEGKGDGNAGNGETAKVVDPLQWWGALTQQFQQIAATAMQEVAASTEAAAQATKGSKAASAAASRKTAAPRKRAARQASAG